MYGKSKEAAEGPVASLLCSGVFCGLVAQPSEDAGLAALCASVAVAITVAGAVVAAVAAGVFLDIVEHDAEVFETVLLVHTFQLGQEVALLHSGPDDEEGDVHHAVDDSGIGHGEHRGAVDDDLVVLFAQLAHEFVEPIAHQQFGGVGGKRTGGHEVDAGCDAVLHDDVLATGGTMLAAYNLVKSLNPKKIYINFIIELTALKGRDILPEEVEVTSLIKY